MNIEKSVNITKMIAIILGYLFFVFLILKQAGTIEWNWIWITAPLWGVFAVTGVIFMILLLIALLFGFNKKKF